MKQKDKFLPSGNSKQFHSEESDNVVMIDLKNFLLHSIFSY